MLYDGEYWKVYYKDSMYLLENVNTSIARSSCNAPVVMTKYSYFHLTSWKHAYGMHDDIYDTTNC